MADPRLPAEAAPEVTQLLRAWAGGDRGAADRLFPILYAELRRQAGRRMRRERRHHSLQPTALVHEAYLRLAGGQPPEWRDRGQFFALAAHVMRQVLVDHARRRRAAKREGVHVTLAEADAAAVPLEVLDLEDALHELSGLDPRQAQVVELRYFGGLSVEETGDALGLSPRTVKREWQTARAWLQRRLLHAGGPPR